MSEIRVNTIVAAEGTSAPNLPYGIQVPTGMGITGAGGVNISGVATASSFSGNISGGTVAGTTGTFSGAVSGTTGTFSGAVSGTTGTYSGAVSGTTGTFSGAVSGTTGTFSGAVNVDDTTDSTSSSTGALIIDGGLGIAKNVFIGAGLSVAGTLTYEDATNIDAVGLITAQSGIRVPGGQVTVGVAFSVGAAGVTTAAGFVGPLTGAVTGNADTATTATNVTVADESSDTTCFPTFVTAATGNLPPKSGSNLTFNSSTGNLSATQLSGTLQTATQGSVTSLGTLTGLTISGDVTFTGSSYNVAWDKSDNALEFGDNAKAHFGTGNDLSIFHDGSDNYISGDVDGMDLFIRSRKDVTISCGNAASGFHSVLYADNNGSTRLYHPDTDAIKLQTTQSGTVTTGIGTFTEGANFDGILSEKFNETAGKLSDNTNIDLEDGMIHFFTTTESTTSTPNIRYSSSKSLNNMLNIGDTVSVTVITTAAAAGYSANWNVDGSGVTEEWNGGDAPTEGGAGGYDCYTITLLKRSNASFTVLANLSNFA